MQEKEVGLIRKGLCYNKPSARWREEWHRITTRVVIRTDSDFKHLGIR